MAKDKEQKNQKGRQQQSTQGSNQGTSTGMQRTAGGGESASGQSGLTRREQSLPSLMTGSPFTFMRRFSEEMDRLFEDFGFGRSGLMPGIGRGFDQALWSPQVEMFEREGQLVVRADLPGLTKDDVQVVITDDAIILQGERHNEREENGEGYYHTERSYGSFYREIPLPEGVSADNANATFRNGVLEVTMQAPARQEQSRRRIDIRGESEGDEQPKTRAKAAGEGK